MKRVASAILMLCLATSPAAAKSWVIDYQNSRLGFTGTQGTTPFDGTFKTFTATIDFDPAHPESGKITATIDTSSATTGTAERDSTMPRPDWFDVKAFPEAKFSSDAIRSTGSDKAGYDCYEANGNLTIKSITKPVKLPFCLKPEGDHVRAQGQLSLLRTDFNLGTGQWTNEAYVKFPVVVTVDLAAKPGP